MKLPLEIRERFQRYGRDGGKARAANLTPEQRKTVARRAATARWIRVRFGETKFEALGLPGGEIVDAGLADLAADKVTLESLLVSLAEPRLRREGVPLGSVQAHPEDRLYQLLCVVHDDLAFARYGAYLRRISSFADACHLVREMRSRL